MAKGRVSFNVRKYTDPLDRAIATLPEFREEMDDVGKVAEEQARAFTNSRPSAKSGKPGRATGTDMADDITHTMTSPGANRFQLRVGWLRDAENWYKLQDQGFWHWRGGGWIEGTHALRDVSDNATDMMEDRALRFRKRIAKIAVGKEK